jgi:hypothetical protein
MNESENPLACDTWFGSQHVTPDLDSTSKCALADRRNGGLLWQPEPPHGIAAEATNKQI